MIFKLTFIKLSLLLQLCVLFKMTMFTKVYHTNARPFQVLIVLWSRDSTSVKSHEKKILTHVKNLKYNDKHKLT